MFRFRIVLLVAVILALFAAMACSQSATATPVSTSVPAATATSNTPTATSNQYSVKVMRGGQLIGELTLAKLKTLPAQSVTIYGKAQNGPTLLSALQLVGVNDFTSLTLDGLDQGRTGTTELTLNKADVTSDTVLDFTQKGTVKLATPSAPEDRWVIDVSEIKVQ